jgi:CheY-like chemotaxis protein
MATILIVEDEVFICLTAEWTLEELGHRVLFAENLGEALVHLSAVGEIDALFVDIRLNNLALGGYEVADRAIALRPDLRVLYTSGSPITDEMSNRFVRAGQFIQKPYTPAQLGVSIQRLLHEQIPTQSVGLAPA